MTRRILFIALINLFASNAIIGMEKETSSEIRVHKSVNGISLEMAKDLLKTNYEYHLEACRNGDVEMVKLLIAAGADVNLDDYLTPLEIAISQGYIELLELLLASGANVKAKNRHGSTPLEFALKGNNSQIVKLLIEKIEKDDDVSFALYVALSSSRWSAEIIQLLLDNGAKVNFHCNRKLHTPLHLASGNASKKIVKILLEPIPKFKFS